MNMHFQVTQPCSENPEQMNLKDGNPFCERCQHSVMDFRGMNNEDITAYLKQHKGQKVCGFFHQPQLPIKTEFRIRVYPPFKPSLNTSSWAYFAIGIGALLHTSCNNSAITQSAQSPALSVQTLKDSTDKQQETDTRTDTIDSHPTGFISIDPNPHTRPSYPKVIERLQVEPPGIVGMIEVNDDNPDIDEDSLSKFLSKALIYPEEALQNNISGTILMVIKYNSDGSIISANLLKHQEGLDLLEKEAIRVALSIPARILSSPADKGNIERMIHLPIEFLQE